MPSNLIKTKEDEKYWEKAKKIAKKKMKKENEDFYKYAVGIFKRMKGNK